MDLKWLVLVLRVKILLTLLVWAGPMLLVPESLLIAWDLPRIQPLFFRYLLGAAYLALTVGYLIGHGKAVRGQFPRSAVIVGIVSNGLASLILFAAALLGAYSEMIPPAQLAMYFSAIATGGITLGLVATGAGHLRKPLE